MFYNYVHWESGPQSAIYHKKNEMNIEYGVYTEAEFDWLLDFLVTLCNLLSVVPQLYVVTKLLP